MGKNKPNLLYGAVVCMLGYLCIALMGTCSKLAGDIPTSVIAFTQNIISFLLILPFALRKGVQHLKTKRKALHLLRDLTGVLSFFFLFFSLKSIPLVDAILLQNTAPLWIPLVVLIGLRVKMRGHLWWGLVLGFLGVIFVLKPGSSVFSYGSIAGVGSGILLGISLVTIRRLTLTEPVERILFYYFLVGVICMAPFAVAQASFKDFSQWYYLLGVGVFMILAQLLITHSFEHGKASVFAPIAYSAVVFSGILGWLIWGHIPDFWSFIGLCLVVLGGVLSILVEKKYENKMEGKSE